MIGTGSHAMISAGTPAIASATPIRIGTIGMTARATP